MTLTNAYLTLAEFKSLIGKTTVDGDDACERAIEAASRAVDAWCGRRFYADAAATARVFAPFTASEAWVDDIHTTTDLVVKTDTGDDGTYETTWTTGDYELMPRNGIRNGLEGWPYTAIRAVEGLSFPCGRRATVQVTARWGWAAVPTAVELAAQILAMDFWKSKDAPFGIAGLDSEFGSSRIRSNPQVKALLSPFVKQGGIRIA
jgi:hypothetical protein